MSDPFESWEEGERQEPTFDFSAGQDMANSLDPESEPAAYFLLFVPEQMTNFIAGETNRYAEQVIGQRGN